jgi:hypothetical protein
MQCTLIGLIDSMFYLSLPYFFFTSFSLVVYCLTSPLRIGDTYALCFPSAHELHSVHTMFLFGCFINLLILCLPLSHWLESQKFAPIPFPLVEIALRVTYSNAQCSL